MPDNSPQIVGPLNVWTVPAQGGAGALLTASGAAFPWSWAWSREPLLQATGNKFVKRPGAMGSGIFTLLRDTRQEPTDTNLRTYNSPLIAGQYVCITADTESDQGGPLIPDNVLWWGWISALSYSQFDGSLDGVGAATALEVGHLLDQQQILTWKRESPGGTQAETISAPPTANLGDAASYIIGNAKSGIRIGNGGEMGYAFARLPEECGTGTGTLWTRWRLLRHLLFACQPAGMPLITLTCADGSEGAPGPQDNDPTDVSTIAGFLNDTSVPEVFDLRNLTIKGAIDLCVPRSRGLNWTLELVAKDSWQLVVYSQASLDSAGSLPVNGSNSWFSYSDGGGTDLTADELTTDVKVISDSGSMPDEVVIEGSPIVFGNTVSFLDGNVSEGWQRGTGTQEDIYRLGGSTAADYGSLTPEQQDERNAMVRTSAGVRDVYTRFGLYAYQNGDVFVSTTPGTGSGGEVPLCPAITWDGSAIGMDSKTSRCPYLPSAGIMRTLPWPEGVKGDGTDLRPPKSQFLPVFLKPRILRYDATDSVHPWVDLESRNGRGGFPSMSVDAEDRGASIRVALSVPEYLAYRHWSDPSGGTTTPATSGLASGQDPDTDPTTIDYTNLVLTIGIESDQKVSVSILRPGVSSQTQVRRRLILRDPNLMCWVMRAGAIIGIQADGTPERITNGNAPFSVITGAGGDGGVVIRNDYPLAQKRADMAASWAFRERTSVRIQRARPDVPPEPARIGYLISTLIEADGVELPVNTVVEEITYDFSMSPRIEVATTLPEMIGFAPVGIGGSGGGKVSAVLGGSIPQAIMAQRVQAHGLVSDTQRVPIIVPRAAPSLPPKVNSTVDVHQVSHGFSVYNVVSAGTGDFSAGCVAVANNLYESQFGGTAPVGVVVSVLDADNYTVGLWGYFNITDTPPLASPGVVYCMSSMAGLLVGFGTSFLALNQFIAPVLFNIGGGEILIYGHTALLNSASIRSLFDVDVNYSGSGTGQVTTGDVLRYNSDGPFWHNVQDTVGNIVDVALTSLANGDVLTYDLPSTKWKNVSPSGSGTHAAASVFGRSAATTGALADIASATDGQVFMRTSGTLGWSTIQTANIAAGAVTGTSIASATVTGGNIAAGTVTNANLVNSSLTIAGTAPITISGSGALGGTTTVAVSDATTGAKGVVQLAGDLAGTAAAPVIANLAITAAKIANNTVSAAKIVQALPWTVVGNATNATANAVGFSAATDGDICQLRGTALGFSQPQPFNTTQVYAASTTFTVPTGIYLIYVLARAGGGGGGGVAVAGNVNFSYASSGGGQGGLGIGWLKVVPGQTVTITIGGGGGGGNSTPTDGSDGSASSATSTGCKVEGLGGSGGSRGGAAGGDSNVVSLGNGSGGGFTSSFGGGLKGHCGADRTFSNVTTTTIGGTPAVTGTTTLGGLGGGSNSGSPGDGGAGSASTVGTSGHGGYTGQVVLIY